jgi:acetyl-CoA carboxylase biotin carboxyl carrier protein
VNPKEIKELIELLSERRIAEFEMEGLGFKLRVRTGSVSEVDSAPSAPVSPKLPSAPAASPAAAAAPAAPPPPPAAAQKTHVIKAPIVGTFYRAANPTAKSYVEVGSRVQPGAVLCIIEAMKLLNEIESDVSGEIIEVHVENAKPVEYGQPLFTVKLD